MGRYDDRYRERVNDYWHYRDRQDDYKYNQRVTDHQTSMDHFWIKDSLRDRPSPTISNKIDTISDPATSIKTRAISNRTISNKTSSISDSKSDVDNKLSTEIQRQSKKVIKKIQGCYYLHDYFKYQLENDLLEIDLLCRDAEKEIENLCIGIEEFSNIYYDIISPNDPSQSETKEELNMISYEMRSLLNLVKIWAARFMK